MKQISKVNNNFKNIHPIRGLENMNISSMRDAIEGRTVNPSQPKLNAIDYGDFSYGNLEVFTVTSPKTTDILLGINEQGHSVVVLSDRENAYIFEVARKFDAQDLTVIQMATEGEIDLNSAVRYIGERSPVFYKDKVFGLGEDKDCGLVRDYAHDITISRPDGEHTGIFGFQNQTYFSLNGTIDDRFFKETRDTTIYPKLVDKVIQQGGYIAITDGDRCISITPKGETSEIIFGKDDPIKVPTEKVSSLLSSAMLDRMMEAGYFNKYTSEDKAPRCIGSEDFDRGNDHNNSNENNEPDLDDR